MLNKTFETLKDFFKYLLFEKVESLGVLSEIKKEWNLTEEAAQICHIELPIKSKIRLKIKVFLESLVKDHIKSFLVIPLAIVLHFALGIPMWMLPISLFITGKIYDKVSNDII